MVTPKSYADAVKKDVFTTKGAYAGKIADVDLDMEKFRIRSLVVDAIKGSFLSSMVGDKRGVIVPFAMVQAIGDIVIIKHIQPTGADEPVKEAPQMA
jgi:sporulation protein YlmC with PRC-barrel domain